MHLLQNLCPDDGVNLHLLEFLRREFPRLGDDVLRYSEFSDVMQHRRSLQRFLLVIAQSQVVG